MYLCNIYYNNLKVNIKFKILTLLSNKFTVDVNGFSRSQANSIGIACADCKLFFMKFT